MKTKDWWCIRDTEIALLKNDQEHVMEKLTELEKKIDHNHAATLDLFKNHMAHEEWELERIIKMIQKMEEMFATKIEHKDNENRILKLEAYWEKVIWGVLSTVWLALLALIIKTNV